MKNESRVLDMARHFHPQTDPRLHEDHGPLTIMAGEGATIIDDAGNRYIEGMGGLWCASLGFSDSRLADAADRQMRKLAVYHTFNHRSNEPTIELVEQLAALAPFEDARVFLVGSGSEANDTMVKLAWYYQAARGRPDKRKIISRFGAFHGSTIMGAALSGLPHMHQSFNLPPLPIIFAARPFHYFDSRPAETERDYATRLARELEALILAEGPESIAAMIAEPVMGAGGVLVPPEDYFPKIQSVLRKYDILMLSDEVVCGFGRTGNWFGSQTFGMEPDMLSIAKGLSSGHLPIGGVIISDKVYQWVADEAHKVGVFGHGFTYSGHPVTAAVAAEAIRIYREVDLVNQARRLGDYLHRALAEALGDHPLVGEVRGRGFIAGVQIVEDRATRRAFAPELRIGTDVERRCRDHGVMIRNMGDVLAICPPYIITKREIDALVGGIRSALDGAAAANSRVGQVA
ncbi:aminotransferase [Mesorhizobium sp.]|uniref:aminotransferase n=1 Tax=Mesorhizobium sp. TaxID=1871066 RepID=UPI000FE9ECB5|nr:aminotransferase [Mesorhizobium sp.]RWO86337.1 MAG: aminotransferase class III-fold pyridoxal phosphate-dependent enzyme [Mesorhizobium sp.]